MNGTRPSSLVPYNNNAAMRIKSVQDSPQFRFRLWGFSGVVFLSVIYPSLFFSFVFTVPFFPIFFSYDGLPGSSHTDRLTFTFVCLFWFIRRVLSSDATVADLAIFSEKEERPTPKIEEFKHISLATMKPFFGAASSLILLVLLDSTAAQQRQQQQSPPTQSTRINFQDPIRDNNQRPNLFNNNIDPFSRRPFGVGDNANAIFEEP